MAWRLSEGAFRSLRFRLTFWNTAILLLIVSATLLGLRQALLWTMLRELDHLLAEDAYEVALVLRSHFPRDALVLDALERKARSHTEDGWFVQVFLADGTLHVATQSAGDVDGPTVHDIPHGAYSYAGRRIVHRRLNRPELPHMVIRVGVREAGVTEDVDRLTSLLL